MKATNAKVFVIAVLSLATILLVALLPNSPFSMLVYAADSYGDDISYVEVWQYNGSDWNLKANFTVSDGSARINDNVSTRFVVMVMLNDTLASSSVEAQSYTKVYMNITDGGAVWTNALLNDTGTPSNSGGFYWVQKEGNWTSGLPVAGVTYNCTVNYQAYY